MIKNLDWFVAVSLFVAQVWAETDLAVRANQAPQSTTFNSSGEKAKRALLEISDMRPQQCRDIVYLNELFYSRTREMTEEQRVQDFGSFQREIDAKGLPRPLPPPAPDSELARSLKKCAESE